MARNQKDFTFDYDLQLKDAGLIAADAAAQVSGADKILDLGASRFDGRVIVDISAIEVASGNEGYKIKTQFSNSSSFASGIIGGPLLYVGDSSLLIGESADSVVGRYELPFCNEINGTTYRYMRLYTDVEGTIATGINYSAFVVQVL
jgi:hypothetical protein